MHLTSTLIGLLIIGTGLELPTPIAAQFWKTPNKDNNNLNWRNEALARRPSGICYKTLTVDTVNPNSRSRQISFCCNDYVNKGNNQLLKCEPICREDCSNGLCITPGDCECAPGYERRDRKCRNGLNRD
ncbi:platelet endothelial aggregation receptor 1 [Drosophila rhopaloa]|uniref:Platelet endothelial aggregation receptor 1-like n=1 Tax=Drosophila rhopaloa TaxID=1041015 RepID=A0ABM5I3S8_DRORH|nr:platelet endothelial aggregation receptor 1 [Drosophila rhopaloa]